MKERGKKVGLLGSITLGTAVALSACGGEQSTPQPTKSPEATPSSVPTETFKPSPTPTETPVFSATPEPTPNTIQITGGESFFEHYTEWKQSNPDSVNPTEYKTDIETFLKDNLNNSTDQDLSIIYKLLITDGGLSTELGFITSGKSDTAEFVGACSDMVKYMALANNKGVEGSLDYAYKAEVLCDTYAKKRNMDTDFLHGEITKSLDRTL